MTLQQLRCLCTVVDLGLNLSRAARAMNTSQPAVTKMIRAMEDELGVALLVRAGPRIVTVTEAGQEAVTRARHVLREMDNLRLAASDRRSQTTGAIRIATSHLHARYALLDIIQRFTRRYPEVDINLTLGSQSEIARWTSAGEIDLCIGALPENTPANLLRLDAYAISRCLIAPLGHPILKKKRPTLKDIGSYPLITYDNRSRTGEMVERTFMSADITPKVTLKANSADIVKTYVSAGMGIAIMQTLAVEKTDTRIRAIKVDYLFPPSTAWILLRKDLYLRGFVYEFIAMVSPKWTAEAVDRARLRSYLRHERPAA